jgi:DNA-binding response OmpR family regulator
MDAKLGAAVLLLEDQPLIAMDVEELLQQAGFSSILTYSSCAAAREWLQQNEPTFAVIETGLRDGSCEEIACLLVQRGIRFVVHSADPDNAGKYKGLSARCSWMEKPCNHEDFLAVVRKYAAS